LNEDHLLNPVAELDQPDSGDIIQPVHAKPGDKLFCPDHDCKDSERVLFLKRSSLGTPFFSHRPGFSHPIYPQTLLHKLAVRWFQGKTTFEIPSGVVGDQRISRKLLQLDPAKTELEFRQYQSVIPDVLVESITGYRLAIEIVVTSDVSFDKSKLLQGHNLPTVCIDLTKFYLANRETCRVDVDFITNNLDALLTDIKNKRWIRCPVPDDGNTEIEWSKQEAAPSGSCLLSLVTLLLMAFVTWIYFKSN